MDAVKDCRSITFLNHESAEIRLVKEGGPRTKFKVFGSPYSPARGRWAFGYSSEQASSIWEKIPLDAEVVITHTPPKYHCDESRDRGAAGCEILRQNLWRIRPCLAICGHVHEGRGVERVLWDLESSNIKFKESKVQYWIDPGQDNKKQCLVDLTSKRADPLDNTGSFVTATPLANTAVLSEKSGTKSNPRWKKHRHPLPSLESKPELYQSISNKGHSLPTRETFAAMNANLPTDASLTLTLRIQDRSSALHGQGGIPPSGRCDLEALSGRMARRETCVINAAMMASSWPHSTSNIKKYNKPIVVDIDLPTWET